MFIYVLRNKKNGKCYVGQDSGEVAKLSRVKEHFATAKRVAEGKPLKCESKLIPAIIKYGEQQFEILVVSQDHESKSELDAAEIELILQLDAVKNGYNILPGGQGMPSNAAIKNDPLLLASLHAIRSRGAKTANKNRWAAATGEDRKAIWKAMQRGRAQGTWRKNIQESWDKLSDDDRKKRGVQMKDGRPFRFVLIKNNEEIVETNLRSLLAHLTSTPVSKRNIERLVRNENKFYCEEFKIEKRQHR